MAIEYLPLLMLVIVATIMAGVAVILPSFLGPSRKNEQKNQPYQFVRSTIIPFLKHCNGDPVITDTAATTFIIVWRPAKHPSELVYGWATDIKYPANEQGNSVGGYMSWGISVGAIA